MVMVRGEKTKRRNRPLDFLSDSIAPRFSERGEGLKAAKPDSSPRDPFRFEPSWKAERKLTNVFEQSSETRRDLAFPPLSFVLHFLSFSAKTSSVRKSSLGILGCHLPSEEGQEWGAFLSQAIWRRRLPFLSTLALKKCRFTGGDNSRSDRSP